MGNIARLVNTEQYDNYINSLYNIQRALFINYNNKAPIDFIRNVYNDTVNWESSLQESNLRNCATSNATLYFPINTNFYDNQHILYGRLNNANSLKRDIVLDQTYNLNNTIYNNYSITAAAAPDALYIDTDCGLGSVRNWFLYGDQCMHLSANAPNGLNIVFNQDVSYIDYMFNGCYTPEVIMSPISDLILGYIKGLYTDSFIANFGNNVTWRYWNSCRFNNAEIYFGDDCYLSELPYVFISGNITFGNNCKVDNAFRINEYYRNLPYKGSINMVFGDNCNVNFIHNQWNVTKENKWDFNITFGNDCYISRVIPRNYLSWNYCYLNIGNNCICNNLTDYWGSLNAVTIRLGYNCNFTKMGLNDYDNTILELPTGGYNANDFPYSVRRNIRWY